MAVMKGRYLQFHKGLNFSLNTMNITLFTLTWKIKVFPVVITVNICIARDLENLIRYFHIVSFCNPESGIILV